MVPATATRTTADVAHMLDEEVGDFPAAIDLPMESGVPVVWAFNGHVTGIAIVIDGVVHVTRDRVTRAGNIEAGPLTERDHEADDRWRIDLRTDAGCGFALRVLARRPLVMSVQEFDLLTWKHLVGKVTSHERRIVTDALARGVA